MDSYREIENLIYQNIWLTDHGKNSAEIMELYKYTTFFVPPNNDPVPAADMFKFAGSANKRWGPDNKKMVKHNVSNLWIEVDEEAGTAKSRCYVSVMQAVPEIGFKLQCITCGTYHDTFKRHEDGKWWYDTHRLDLDLVGELCNHRVDFSQGGFEEDHEGRPS